MQEFKSWEWWHFSVTALIGLVVFYCTVHQWTLHVGILYLQRYFDMWYFFRFLHYVFEEESFRDITIILISEMMLIHSGQKNVNILAIVDVKRASFINCSWICDF